tara:strand:+ start:41 stop:322 length:282 start_codon:yes stop_codon:yes gene_type:complete
MPISYPELEDVLIEWKKFLNVIKSKDGRRTEQWVYNNMKDTAQDRYIKKITSLFKKMNIDNLKVIETINPDRTYGKLTQEKTIIINNNQLSSL